MILLRVLLILHLTLQVITEEDYYTLCKCNKDPTEDDVCLAVGPENEEVERRNHQRKIQSLQSGIPHTEPINPYRINIWVLVPFEDCYLFSKMLIEPAIYQALEDENATLCSNLTEKNSNKKEVCFAISIHDTEADPYAGLITAMEVEEMRNIDEKCGKSASSNDTMDIMLGMSCDFVTSRVSGLTVEWDWPVVFPGVRSNEFDDKNKECCRTATRTGHSMTDFARFVHEFYTLGNHPWNQTSLYYSGLGTHHGAHLRAESPTDCEFLMGGIQIIFEEHGFNISQRKGFSSDAQVINESRSILTNLKDTARVSIWCVGREAMQVIMNTAATLGMTSGQDEHHKYVFNYIDLYNNNASYSWSRDPDTPYSCSSVNASDTDHNYSMNGMEALQVLTLHRPQTEKFTSFSDKMRSKTTSSRFTREYDQYSNHYVTQYYNSMRLVLKGVKAATKFNADMLQDGAAFAEQLWNTSFESVDGTVFIDEHGNQLMNYAIMDLNRTTNLFQKVSVFYGHTKTWEHISPIDWPGERRPDGLPPCRGSYDCEVSAAVIASIVLSLSLLFCCVALIAIMARRNAMKERKLTEMAWKLKEEDIVFNIDDKPTSRRSSSVSSVTNSSSGINGGFGRQIFGKRARWKNEIVSWKKIDLSHPPHVDRRLQIEMDQMISLNHDHICKFYGVRMDGCHIDIVTEYCPRGSLQDFLDGTLYDRLDDMLMNILISDIANGMLHLHKSPILCHGNLKASNCVIDSRLVLKLTDFGLPSFKQRHRSDSQIGYDHYKDLLWTAPELLRLPDDAPFRGTQAADVYSFAIIVQEILYRKGAFYLGKDEKNLNPVDICTKVIQQGVFPFRPTLQDNDDVVVGDEMRGMVRQCWAERPQDRMSFKEVLDIMKKQTKKRNLIDRVVERLEQHSSHLEERVAERTDQYRAEKDRADNLLYQMLPQPVADKLKSRQAVEPTTYDCVTIYFSDIVGFTSISHKSNAFEVVKMLDDLYTIFDDVVGKYDVYKVETIGDAYMLASGLPKKNGNEHVRFIAQTALRLMEKVKNFKIPHMPDECLKIRVGIHSGPVVTGVVGKKMPRYCLFGDTVNTAARMEQSGEGMKIQLSPMAKSLLDNFETFIVKERENPVPLKGLGTWKTWWLEGEIEDGSGDTITTLLPTEDSASFNNNLGKKVSHTSDYGSARSSTIDAVAGVDQENNRAKLSSAVTDKQGETWAASVDDEDSNWMIKSKRRPTAIPLAQNQSEEIFSFYEMQKRERQKSLGLLRGIDNLAYTAETTVSLGKNGQGPPAIHVVDIDQDGDTRM